MEQTISCTVEGMTCGNCAITISKILEKKGMTHISANAASGEVSFTAAEGSDIAKVYDAIDGLGYHVVREPKEGTFQETGKEKKLGLLELICLILTLPLLSHMFINWHVLHMPLFQFVLATPVFAIGWYVFGGGAYRSVLHGIPNMNVLILLGSTAAYIYSVVGWLVFPAHAHEYMFFETAAMIITLVMVGNWLEHRTVKSTTVAIDALAKLQPQTAKLVMTDSIGKETLMTVESKYVRVGDVVLVNTGDNIPVDGEVIYGDALVDEHMITGESMPVHKYMNDGVVGGTVVQQGSVKVKTTAIGEGSVLASIIRMVREAQATKPALQKLADKISAIFVPVVLGISVITLIINYFFVSLPFQDAMMRSIAVLVIACPCAMGLATPAAIAVGLGRAARMGILIKGGSTLEQLKTIRQIVFDKTGTLTTGKLQIESYKVTDIDDAVFKSVVASIERHSSHPIAKSITAQWNDVVNITFKSVVEVKGNGMEAMDEQGDLWQLGSKKWLANDNNTHFDLYLYKNGDAKGGLYINDTLRPDAQQTIHALKLAGYKTILLSGDTREKCNTIAAQLGIDEVYAGQTPEQKNQKLDEWMQHTPTAMVGDGINDAPALARATVGMSLSDATHIAIQSANVILSNDQLSTLPAAIRLGIYTEQTIKQNLFWAFIYNVVAIPFAASGYMTPTWGAGIMAMSDIVLILNSLRLGKRKLY
ncbi:MAG: cation-translocating P-type ATPase [Bacteroidota bacterium]